MLNDKRSNVALDSVEVANRSWVSSACFSEIQSRSRAAPVSSHYEQLLWAACEQSEQPEEPAPMHNGLRLAVWIKESEQLSSLAYSQIDSFGHFCHVLVAFKTRNTLAWWEVTCLEKKLCDIGRGRVTWREVRLCLQGCKRFFGQPKLRWNLQVHSLTFARFKNWSSPSLQPI